MRWPLLGRRHRRADRRSSGLWTAAEEAAQSAAEEEFEADNVDGDSQPMTPDETIDALVTLRCARFAAANQTMADQLWAREPEKLLDSVPYTSQHGNEERSSTCPTFSLY